LMALVEYVRAHPRALAMARSVSVTVNGKLLHRFSASASEERAEEQVFRVNTALLRPGRNVIRLQCDGPGSPFYAIAIKTYLANGLDKPATADPAIVVERTYSILRPGVTEPLDAAPQNAIRGPVAPGTVIRVRLTIRTSKELHYVIVTDPYPAGYEPLVLDDNSSGDGWFDALDLRDDHAAIFAPWLPPGRYVVEYVVRAGRRGSYGALPARVEGMYEPSLWAETPVTTVDVR